MKYQSTLLAAVALFSLPALGKKRGLAFIQNGVSGDQEKIIAEQNSKVEFYWSWSLTPPAKLAGKQVGPEFLPQVHSPKDHGNLGALNNLPQSSKHLLTYNEPDEEIANGGTKLDAAQAAKDYIEKIVPLRNRWKISHPCVTGSPRGLNWLREFNKTCYSIDKKNGCPADFIAMHWFGEAAGLKDHLPKLEAFYNDNPSTRNLKVWVTELGIPGATTGKATEMMKQSSEFLDKQDQVEGYAWFGAFRPSEKNDWTGAGIALFEENGALSNLGKLYFGQ